MTDQGGTKAGRVHIGTSGWNYAHWRGRFYPDKLPAREWLPYYAERFRSVEVNKSHYRLLTPEETARWAEQTPDDFLFAVKAHRFTTHNKKLKDPVESTIRFFPPLESLGEKLGPILFQLPPKWGCNAERLDAFIAAMPPRYRQAYEFRHEAWFCADALDVLRRHSAAFCIYELAGLRSPEEVTAPFVYIRLHGPGGKYQGSYDDATLAAWADKIRAWTGSGLDVYCYFDNDDSAYAVFNAMTLRAMLEAT